MKILDRQNKGTNMDYINIWGNGEVEPARTERYLQAKKHLSSAGQASTLQKSENFY